jgi:hypothetical protein
MPAHPTWRRILSIPFYQYRAIQRGQMRWRNYLNWKRSYTLLKQYSSSRDWYVAHYNEYLRIIMEHWTPLGPITPEMSEQLRDDSDLRPGSEFSNAIERILSQNTINTENQTVTSQFLIRLVTNEKQIKFKRIELIHFRGLATFPQHRFPDDEMVSRFSHTKEMLWLA